MNAVSVCQNQIRRELGFEHDLLLVDGIAVGYPEPDSAINNIPRDRLPVKSVVKWMSI